MANVVKECHKLAFPSSSTFTVNDAQIHSEILHTNFNVQHNISFLTADHMSPDSKMQKLSQQPNKNNKYSEQGNVPNIKICFSRPHGRKSF